MIDNCVNSSRFPNLLVSNYCLASDEELLCQFKEWDLRECDSPASSITSWPHNRWQAGVTYHLVALSA